MHNTKKMEWIQALRGIAALMVLFFHMRPHWELSPYLSPVSKISSWGFVGVDIFFVLSGFVIYLSAHKSVAEKGLYIFLLKRFSRVFLGYWPALILLALTTLFIFSQELPNVEKILFSVFLLYPNMSDNWLSPAWSLTMELYFYSWIAVIALFPRQFHFKVILFTILLLLGWGLGWLFFDRPLVFNGEQPLRFVLTGLGIEFLMGAMIANFYIRKNYFTHKNSLTFFFSIALIISGLVLGMSSPYFDRVEILRALSFGLAGVGFLIISILLENSHYSPPKWLINTGNASFSLYLIHIIILDISGLLRFTLNITSVEILLIYLLLLPLVIIFLSNIWFQYIEKPILNTFHDSYKKTY